MAKTFSLPYGPSVRSYVAYVDKLTNQEYKRRMLVLDEVRRSFGGLEFSEIDINQITNRLLAGFIPENNIIPPAQARIEEIGSPVARVAVNKEVRELKKAGMPNAVLRQMVPRNQITVIDLFESGLGREELSVWAGEGVDLIKSAVVENKQDFMNNIVESVRAGRRWESLAKDIEAQTGVLSSRARLIAQDQVAKLNGKITQSMQARAGVDSYIWVTVGDERVRESHRAINGMKFSWSTGAPGVGFYKENGHPGQCGRCRCRARPVAPDWWNNL